MNVLELLKKHEWRTGRCAECGGWQKPSAAETNPAAYPGGHKKDCAWAKAIEDCK